MESSAPELIDLAGHVHQVGIDLGAVSQVIGDDCVDVVEIQNREILRDLLRRSASHERVDHGVQGYPRSPDSDHPAGVHDDDRVWGAFEQPTATAKVKRSTNALT